ncbi:MAG: PAS domain S-box protein [Syntrophobacteraceae bacterium]
MNRFTRKNAKEWSRLLWARGANRHTVEYRIVRPDGSVRWILDRGGPVRDASGEIYRIAGIAEDVTERKQVEETLKERDARFRLTLKNAGTAVFAQNKELVYVEIFNPNPHLTKEMVLQKKDEDLFSSKDSECLSKIKRTVLKTGVPAREEVTVTFGEDTFIYLLNVDPVYDKAGTIEGICCAATDITERKLAERALRESEDKFKGFAEQALSGTYLIQDDVFKYVNPKFAEIFGYTVEECLNDLPFKNLVYAEDVPVVEEQVRNRVSGKTHSSHYIFKGLRKDGQVVYVEIFGSQIVYKGKPAAIGTILDITERIRGEEERLQLQQRLQQARKAESLGRMAGAIAHNFNNMLGAVIGNLDLARDEVPEGAELKKWIEEAMDASQRAANISRFMLTYLGQSAGKAKILDPATALRQSYSLLSPSFPKDLRLKVKIPSGRYSIRADEAQLTQIFTNLIENAREAIREQKGEISLTLDAVHGADIRERKLFPLEWMPGPQEYARISIEDSGSGISPEILDNIFDPFFSTKFTGRGLGLAVVLGLLRSADGAIGVESRPGAGTCFELFFPLLEQVETAFAKETASVDSPVSRRKLILVVDDEEPFRRMAEAMLKRKFGYEVASARDGFEAVAVFKERKEEIDVVLLDIGMPEMDGWETLSVLRKLRPDIPVILSSGYDEARAVRGNRPEKPQAFLAKPYGSEVLKAAIEAALK